MSHLLKMRTRAQRTECISGKKNLGSESGDQTGSFHEKKLGDENLVQADHLTNIKRS